MSKSGSTAAEAAAAAATLDGEGGGDSLLIFYAAGAERVVMEKAINTPKDGADTVIDLNAFHYDNTKEH